VTAVVNKKAGDFYTAWSLVLPLQFVVTSPLFLNYFLPAGLLRDENKIQGWAGGPTSMCTLLMLMPCVSKGLDHFCVLVRRHVVLSC
jgi:hypothetical protein